MHYKLTAIIKKDDDIDQILEPYNEEIRVPATLVMTRKQLLARMKEKYPEIKDENELIDKDYHLHDAEGNAYTCGNPNAKYDYYNIEEKTTKSKFLSLLENEEAFTYALLHKSEDVYLWEEVEHFDYEHSCYVRNEESYIKKFIKTLKEADDDSLFYIIDCHI